ncbi:hypothetical protein V6Z11_D04G210000 [Gossypium hirsutum]
MSFTLTHSLFLSQLQQTHLRFTFKPHTSKPIVSSPSKLSYRLIVSSLSHNSELLSVTQAKPRWENMLSTAASLYPLYVTVGGIVACLKPSAFAWFVERGPSSYSFSLGTQELAQFVHPKKSFCENFRNGLLFNFQFELILLEFGLADKILFGCVAQYTIMPTFAMVISKTLGLSPSLSVGLILLGCCPGDAAWRDVSLSTVMTVCTTLGAVILTPLLTMVRAGTYVPVDAIGLSVSTLQVVVAPVLLGSYLQRTFPLVVKMITPFAPLLAVLLSSLLACRLFVHRHLSIGYSLLPMPLYGDPVAVILSVMLLHFTGFFVGYISAAICRFREAERRAISIEVSMQNSSLGVVLATTHFTSPVVALPPAISAVIMNIMIYVGAVVVPKTFGGIKI